MEPEELTPDEFSRWWRETGEHELRQILLWRWDPIGVADYFPTTADEYDDYAPPVVEVLRSGGDAKAVAAHLRGVEHDSMDGPLSSGEQLGYVGELIREWYGNSVEAWSKHGPVRR